MIKKRQQFAIVLVTAPSMRVARKLAKVCIESRLAACVNLVAGIESHYTWQGKAERGKEVLMIMKTTRACLKPLKDEVLRNHPYDTPEFIAFRIHSGETRYLSWILASTRRSKGLQWQV